MDVTATVETFTSGSLTIPHMTMTAMDIPCPAPVLLKNFDDCHIPGGTDLWASDGFYSPGRCFSGYVGMCTQTAPLWSLVVGETAVRCIPSGYDCNSPGADPKYAISEYDDLVLSAPAFEIRWRSEDVKTLTGYQSSTTKTGSIVKHGRPTTLTTASQTRTSLATSGTSSGIATPISGQTTSVSSLETSAISNPTQSNNSPSLSSIAGIVVGALLGILGVALITVYLVFRIRRARRDAPSEDSLASAVPRGFLESTSEALGLRGPAELDDEPKELAAHASRRPLGEDPSLSGGSHPGIVSLNQFPVELDGHVAGGVNTGEKPRPP
ncbi:unnamed protein product [Clonostachys chloroleuca]|uniref:Uncharacterized protein n=1 Tax=Clonostachys chloroleuca TaxID=1926264 RepID=A0AA35MFH0_9HYPO|nr:unnamed protein product [Clonostachys chloroleuca]